MPGGAAPIKSGVASSRMDFLRDPYCVGCAGDIYPHSTHFLLNFDYWITHFSQNFVPVRVRGSQILYQ